MYSHIVDVNVSNIDICGQLYKVVGQFQTDRLSERYTIFQYTSNFGDVYEYANIVLYFALSQL